MIRKIKKNEYLRLVEIWESAVINTHNFLKKEVFLHYKSNLFTYFQYVELLGLEKDEILIGFIGIAEENIEMLFVHNDFRGIGVGRRLLEYVIDNLGVIKVDVNEQNRQAVDFYKHMKFVTQSRSELDGEGKDYPILHMTLNVKN
ncbi:GNAT family N-acetyltransferase [Apibacter raozihei]|uniref:GNAT family N-acetyltransferase n=1 Tax=Apibacter raozihei TaxID=2500547 RepID=UPI000FE318A4|nr:GNAT family N-acetyltransferase [Apibacter raozihei]